MILKVVRRGYRLNGKIIRPAGVIVGRKGDVIASEVTPEVDEAKQSATEEDKKGELSS